MKKLTMFLIVGGVLTSCLKEPDIEVDSSQYYSSYFLFYDAGLDLSQPIAIFTANDENGFRQTLRTGADVKFMNSSLTFDTNMVEYRANIEEYVPIGEFIFTDIFGVEYINEIEQNIIGFPAVFDSVSINEDLDIFWKGDPLEAGEFVTLDIFDPRLEFRETFTQDELESIKITIPSAGLRIFEMGVMRFIMTRERISDALSSPGLGGVVHSIYINSKDVKLVE